MWTFLTLELKAVLGSAPALTSCPLMAPLVGSSTGPCRCQQMSLRPVPLIRREGLPRLRLGDSGWIWTCLAEYRIGGTISFSDFRLCFGPSMVADSFQATTRWCLGVSKHCSYRFLLGSVSYYFTMQIPPKSLASRKGGKVTTCVFILYCSSRHARWCLVAETLRCGKATLNTMLLPRKATLSSSVYGTDLSGSE